MTARAQKRAARQGSAKRTAALVAVTDLMPSRRDSLLAWFEVYIDVDGKAALVVWRNPHRARDAR